MNRRATAFAILVLVPVILAACAQAPQRGFAQSKDWKPITTPGKVAVGPQAREDFQGKPIPITKSIRGKRVSGSPLKPEDLVGSVPKFFYSGNG